MIKYYRATVELGHHGKGKPRATHVYIKGENIFEAMENAKKIPAVKHDRMPLDIREISKEEYKEGRKDSLYIQAMKTLSEGVQL